MDLQAAIITLASGIFGLIIFKLLHPKKAPLNGSILGQLWMSWVVMLVVMAKFPALFLNFDAEGLLPWALEIFIAGLLAFSLGVIFFHLRQQFYVFCFYLTPVIQHNGVSLKSLFQRYAFAKQIKSRTDLTAALQAQKVANAELLSANVNQIAWQTALFECNYDLARAEEMYLTLRISQLAKFSAPQNKVSEWHINKRLKAVVILLILLSGANNFHTLYHSEPSVVALAKPSAVEVVKVGAAEALFNQGIYLILSKNYPHAIEVLQQSLHIDPNHAAVWYNLGASYAKLQSAEDEAIEAYKKAVTINPKFSVAWFELGQLYLAQGLTIEAKNAHKALLLADVDKANELYTLIQKQSKSQAPARMAKDVKPNYDLAALNIYGSTASGKSLNQSACKIKPVMTNAEIANCK